jgi:DNA-binding transcriptional regulator YiaG
VPQSVRKVSDDLAQMAVFPLGDQASAKRQHGKPLEMSRYRQTLAHLVEHGEVASVAIALSGPERRQCHAERESDEHSGVATMTNAVARRLESLRTKGAIKDIEVANLLGTRPETVSRWNQGRAYPRTNTEKTLLELEYIIDQLADFYEPSEARQWIFAPQKLLNGTSPAELIRAGRIDDVMRLVGQLRDAVHL